MKAFVAHLCSVKPRLDGGVSKATLACSSLRAGRGDTGVVNPCCRPLLIPSLISPKGAFFSVWPLTPRDDETCVCSPLRRAQGMKHHSP
jgi:hypothetical protein